MRNLVIMPAMANNRERMNLGEYAEEATIIMAEFNLQMQQNSD